MRRSQEEITEEIESLKKIIGVLRKRRHILEEQLAMEGNQARPQLIIEIDSLLAQINTHEQEITQLESHTIEDQPQKIGSHTIEDQPQQTPRTEPASKKTSKRTMILMVCCIIGLILSISAGLYKWQTSTIKTTIITPVASTEVPEKTDVTGMIDPSVTGHPWLYVQNLDFPRYFVERIIPDPQGRWYNKDVGVGSPGSARAQYNIGIILADDQADQQLEKKKFDLKGLPNGAKDVYHITVIRR